MKLVTFEKDGRSAVGLLNAAGTAVHPVPGCADMQTLIDIWPVLDTAAVLRGERPAARERKAARAHPRPVQDVICLGINYFDHAKESEAVAGKGVKAPDAFPIYFSKRVDEAVAPGGDILSHSDLVADLDYEAELAVIIGRPAYNVTEADALDYVFGYTILNDVSARTIQNQHKQWYRGKSLDGFTPMGPWIVTPDEFDVRKSWKIQSRINGELRQDSTTDRMIFHVPYVIAELSQGMTLRPARSSPWARPPAWAWALTRRSGCTRATWSRAALMASAPSPTPFGNPPSGIRLQRPKISQTDSEKERKSYEICNVWFRRSRQRLRFLPA